MAITINGSTGIQMAADDSLEFGTVGISQDNLFSGRKNVIINGDFDVWQRGTGAFTTAGYTADRWATTLNGSSALSVSQGSFALGQTDVPNNPKHYASCTLTSGSLASSQAWLRQKIEDATTLAGENVTLSFWAKADASKDIAVEIARSFGTGGIPSAFESAISVTTCSLTTSWQKFEITAALTGVSGKTLGTDDNDWLGIYFWLEAGSDSNARTNSLGNQSGTFDIAQVQLEKGSQATAFEKRSYGEELALCQRYYYRLQGNATDEITVGSGYFLSATQFLCTLCFPVAMRNIPTGSAASASFEVRYSNTALLARDGLVPTVIEASTTTASVSIDVTGMTGGNGGIARIANDTTKYLDFDAEL